ncbi:hypothetical protein [Microbacterium rhizomatis]|uniref:Alkaline shock response membrane anchor protein AmaP n=1 Tax=Microbacterium rhizomatis TaxID=1631477 RepID=A0A5J5IYH7_9MICO|nr:hypothetical protein [Microbacterium rhizomatis]KAA9106505.1 hypothetical protein F6B43_15320 [Microbacterium rhizomatis]
MNKTNRALNRIVLIVVGALLLALGAAAVLLFAWPPAADAWTTATEAGRTWIQDAVTASAIGGSTLSWLIVGVLAAIVLLVVLLIVLIARLGGGRSRTVLRAASSDTELGRVRIRSGFVSDAIQHSLQGRDEILFSSVSASDVRKQPVMHISVTPRQNTSPRQVLDDVGRLVANLSTLTGEDVPTYISIRSGLRAKLAHDQRRLA